MQYELRRYRRSKCIRISVRSTGILVTAPKWVSQREIDAFVASREAWIQKHATTIIRKQLSSEEKEQLRELTRNRVWEMIDRVNKIYRHNFERVFIRDTFSRWGSCSESGNLNFSLRAGLLPDDLLEYLVAHELSHLKEMNHSERFWRLVERAIPDYRVRRCRLKQWTDD